MRRRVISILVMASCLALVPVTGSTTAVAAGADRAYDDDTVIVKYRPGVTPAEERPLLERAGAERTVEEIGVVDAEVVRVDSDPERVASRLARSPGVAYAEPNLLMRAQRSQPDDSRFSALWGLRNTGQTGGRPGADVNAVKGWQRASVGGFPSGGGAPVGIVDTGIDIDHPDLDGKTVACAERVPPQLQTGGCDDDTGHGTHVAGTIGAIADNGVGVAGVAFNSNLIVCRALGKTPGIHEAVGRVSDIVRCIGWTRSQGARVISMSLAGGPSKTLRRTVKRTWNGGRQGGAVMVAAAGNNAGFRAAYPAAYPQVISVAATNDRDRRAWFSNRHRTVELAAPGVSIVSTRPGDGYGRLSGTSMAVPHVSGVAAHVRRLRPQASARRVRMILRRSVDDLGARGRDTRYGFGRIDLFKAARP